MIFLIEDEALLRRATAEFLEHMGLEVQAFGDAESALEAATKAMPEVAVCDLLLPGMSGLALMRELRALDEAVVCIAVTAHGSDSVAQEAMRAGCYEYLEKPVDLEQLGRLIQRVVDEKAKDAEIAWHRERSEPTAVESLLLGAGEAVDEVRRQIRMLAELGAEMPPVLIRGETGVGKSLVARLLHGERVGDSAPWIPVNCAALPASLVESELFGFERSAFTDAKRAKPGTFEAASGGTLFLDEIGEVPLDVQAKLLHAVESKTVRRLGGLREIPVSCALVAATNVALEAAVTEGRFRADLFHRLAAFQIFIPNLDQRGDADLLAKHFLKEAAKRYRKNVRTLTPAAEEFIRNARWPGNIRELRFALERAVILCDAQRETLDVELLASPNQQPGAAQASQAGTGGVSLRAEGGGVEVTLPDAGVDMADIERAVLEAALAKTDGNVVGAARLLSLTRDAMRYRMKKLGVTGD